MKILKYLLMGIGIIALLWFLAPLFQFGILNVGNGAGLIFAIILILYSRKHHSIHEKIMAMWRHGFGKVFLSIVVAVVLVVAGYVTYTTMQMIQAAENLPEGETTVVVLGCQVLHGRPSLMLEERLLAAYNYLDANKNVNCVLSGGQGPDESMSEAECMYRWLVEKGIDADRLYLEDQSTSTYENLLFSKQVVKTHGLNPEITIITNEFHQYRAKLIAQNLGIKSYSVSGKTLITLLPTYYVRELGGILTALF